MLNLTKCFNVELAKSDRELLSCLVAQGVRVSLPLAFDNLDFSLGYWSTYATRNFNIHSSSTLIVFLFNRRKLKRIKGFA